MSAIVAGAAVGAASLGYGIFKDAKQTAKANEIEASNKRPNQTADPLLQQNVNLAQQQAQIGLPQKVYNNEINGINQTQAGAIAALSNSPNPGTSLSSIVRGGNAAISNLNAQDAAERNRKTLALMQQKGILAGANQNAWNYNYADKYSENLARSQALRGAAGQTEGNIINSGLQLAGITLSNPGTFDGSNATTGIPGSTGYLGDSNYRGIYNNVA